MSEVNPIYSRIAGGDFSADALAAMLRCTVPGELEALYAGAYGIKLRHRGACVYFRGLIEITNICKKNCLYCGIRCGNGNVIRYELTDGQVLEEARFALHAGYGSVVMQGGERGDRAFTQRITRLIREIRNLRREGSDSSLGITLSLGEQPLQVYKEWYQAGATRYLLRIESSNRMLYEKIHPGGAEQWQHAYGNRIQAIRDLQEAGFLTGTGVMIGLPFQRWEDLAKDLLFFREMQVDMVGMGPYIPHRETPLGELYVQAERQQMAGTDLSGSHGELFLLPDNQKLTVSLNMVALLRHLMPHINIAATTALQVLAPDARERALMAGANIIMPNITDVSAKGNYNLYEGKPGVKDDAAATKYQLEKNLEKMGIPIGWDAWGDVR